MFKSPEMKKLIIICSSIVGVIIVLLIIVAIIGSAKPHYVSYDEFEKKLATAAKNYYAKNPSLLPTEDGEFTLNYETLVENKYIRPLTDLLKNGASCSSYVIVGKYLTNYTYIPYLNCPGEYETQELYKRVLDNNKPVTEGNGLYSGRDYYYFRGDVIDNYVSIDDHLFRIVKINNDNTMTLLAQTPYEKYTVWDDRFNSEINYKNGINDFEVSRIKETLKFLGTSTDYLTDTIKTKITAKELCVGRRLLENMTKDNSVECATMSEDKYLVGLITVSDYLEATLDENCTTTESKACANYNFIASSNNLSWTITAQQDNTYKVFYYNKRSLHSMEASNGTSLYLTIFLSNRTFYKSGTGSATDPYIVK